MDPQEVESGADSLGVGRAARYQDGLRVTAGVPSREPDGSYQIAITYDNDSA
ncbi:hypothetical protein [Streptomyces palmae]|uniref:hypothetical protein n=1 Tax=Streptomyces palmae TaxID=1701085 RepID=UPI001432FE11|nr:hypothetical protein [Streptomyces palmae]